MSLARRYLLVAFIVACLAWCAWHLRTDFKSISFASLSHAIPAVALAMTLSLVNYALRIVRWRLYLSRLGHEQSVAFDSLAYLAGFAFTLSPGKVGELMRARYYVSRGMPVGEFGAVSFVERLLDVMAILVLATSVLSLFPAYARAVGSIAIGVAIALCAMLLIPTFVRRYSPRLVQGVTAARSLLRPRTLMLGFVLSVVAWGSEGVGLYLLCSISTSAPIELVPAIGIYAVAVTAGASTMLPGGLVGTEAVMTALLTTAGVALSEALLITILCRLVTLWLAVLLGWIAVFTLRGGDRRDVVHE